MLAWITKTSEVNMKYLVIFICLALGNFFAAGIDMSTISDAIERSFFQGIAIALIFFSNVMDHK